MREVLVIMQVNMNAKNNISEVRIIRRRGENSKTHNTGGKNMESKNRNIQRKNKLKGTKNIY